MWIVFFLIAFLTIAALLWSGAQLFQTSEQPLAARLRELQSHAMAGNDRSARRKGGGFFNGFLYLLSLAGGEGWIRDTERELNQAGIRNKRAEAVYALFNLVFLVVLLAGAAWLQKGKAPGELLLGLLPFLILGYLLPRQVLHYLVRRYRRKLQHGLPDTVDLLGIVLGTGLSLDQALMRVSEEMLFVYPELANEFSTVVMQVRAGQERHVAFQQLVRRTGVEDIKSLAAMIVQSEKFGTSLAQALKVYADALRIRRRLRAEAAVGRASIKMLFPIVILILPVLFVITLVPGLLSVLRDLKLLVPGR
jgi:tight adherence protein C